MSAQEGERASWARAYRPLGPRTLSAQLVLLVAVEAVLFASYRHHEADFHWATHFLVGVSAAALALLGWLALTGAPARGQLLWVLAMHLVAMFPDLLFQPGHQPHDEWMDVFLGHISVHHVSGGTTTWLVIAVATSGAYCGILSRWLAARHAEVSAGLAPGIGIGGSAILRPQRSPYATPLAHTCFGPSAPPQVLLLHGLGASWAIWRPVIDELAQRSISGVAVDLLGFGRSRNIGTRFDLSAHAAAVEAVLKKRACGRPVVAVGHSLGCAVAVAVAANSPATVRRLVLVSPPAFRDPDEARARLARRGWLAGQVIDGSPVASATCGLMCLTRPLAARLTARMARAVPDQVALDSVQHSWPAYRDAVTALLEDNPLPAAIDRPSVPTIVIVSDADEQAPAEDVLAWPHDHVGILMVDGDHLAPLRHPVTVAEAIAEAAKY